MGKMDVFGGSWEGDTSVEKEKKGKRLVVATKDWGGTGIVGTKGYEENVWGEKKFARETHGALICIIQRGVLQPPGGGAKRFGKKGSEIGEKNSNWGCDAGPAKGGAGIQE